MEQFLKAEERETLIEAHRAERDKRQADRIKTILYLDEGKAYGAIAKLLFLDDSALRRYEQEYEAGGGALNAKEHSVMVQEVETINADAMISLLTALEEKQPDAKTIHVISDNAKYNHANKVKVYTEGSRIQIHFLPPYAPNLNLIERVWKFFHKKITYNPYYATYSKFKTTSLDFFENILQCKEELDTLLTENFHVIGKQISQT